MYIIMTCAQSPIYNPGWLCGRIDAFSMFGADNALVDQIYVEVTIVVAIVYCIYLGKIKEDVKKNEN